MNLFLWASGPKWTLLCGSCIVFKCFRYLLSLPVLIRRGWSTIWFCAYISVVFTLQKLLCINRRFRKGLSLRLYTSVNSINNFKKQNVTCSNLENVQEQCTLGTKHEGYYHGARRQALGWKECIERHWEMQLYVHHIFVDILSVQYLFYIWSIISP